MCQQNEHLKHVEKLCHSLLGIHEKVFDIVWLHLKLFVVIDF